MFWPVRNSADLATKSLECSDQSETQLLQSLLQQVEFLRSRAWNVRSVRNAASIAIWATYLAQSFFKICLQLRFRISSTEFNAFIEQVTKKRHKRHRLLLNQKQSSWIRFYSHKKEKKCGSFFFLVGSWSTNPKIAIDFTHPSFLLPPLQTIIASYLSPVLTILHTIFFKNSRQTSNQASN